MFKRLTIALFMTALATPAAFAQAWPDRPIKFLMSAPAGSSIDVLGRTIADKPCDVAKDLAPVIRKVGLRVD